MNARQSNGPRHEYGMRAPARKQRPDPKAIVENLTPRELLLRGGRATGHGIPLEILDGTLKPLAPAHGGA